MTRILVLLMILCSANSFAQESKFCNAEKCRLAKNHEAHFDPYYNGHLCENFDANQADFSNEYFRLQTERLSKISVDITDQLVQYKFDTDSLFNTGNSQQNGIIGLDYKRIRFHISDTKRKEGKLEFSIRGKSNVSGNICDFKGSVNILKILEIKGEHGFPDQATLFAEYELYEDSTQNHAGIFKGTFECSIVIDHQRKEIKLDESSEYSDGYYNRTYVGTWKSYNSGNLKKCIWGDYRLPFTFDFDQGDGEMIGNEKYLENGWTTFGDGSEYDFTAAKPRLKIQWWE
ncbi:hypothetical protein [Croceimicrobium hydrocarbonivorans]|uniref:Uncharacterized protein n=1 Tax=Croceimicrobium hydrocarbonivorans TaxID=2761580 RepID=A0A7H0VHE4_9FLAO|nr:hypothetical protein [Croceimicrobium hydrocarbonivorans]QNR25142.1 hypothetical protein H4K34_04705 [Croceimicrobium hydrocarbonivorans]